MQIYRYFTVCALATLVLACGDEEEVVQPEMGTTEEAAEVLDEPSQYDAPVYGPNDIVIAISDRDGQVRLELTPTNLTMKLSPDSMARLRSQVSSRDLKDDLKAAILASVTEVAIAELQQAADNQRQKVSTHQIRYPVAEVNSLHYRNARLWIDIEREKPLSFDDIKTADGRPVLTNFDEWDGEAFVAAFDSL
jgi:hypothetical protein